MSSYGIEFNNEEELAEFRNLVMDNLSIHRGCVPNRLDNGTYLVESKDVITNSLNARLKLYGNKYPTRFLSFIKNKEYIVGTSFESFFLEKCDFELLFHCINKYPEKKMCTLNISSDAFRTLDRFIVPRGNDDMDPTDHVIIPKNILVSKLRETLVKNCSLKTHVNLMELAILRKIRINVVVVQLPYESILSRVFGLKRNNLIGDQRAIECFIEVF